MRGPSHSNSGLPVTPLGREIEQVRLSLFPATTVDDGDDDIEILADSVENDESDISIIINFSRT